MSTFSPGVWGRLLSGGSRWKLVLGSPRSELVEGSWRRREVVTASLEKAHISSGWSNVRFDWRRSFLVEMNDVLPLPRERDRDSWLHDMIPASRALTIEERHVGSGAQFVPDDLGHPIAIGVIAAEH
jgi:hypothetical protein